MKLVNMTAQGTHKMMRIIGTLAILLMGSAEAAEHFLEPDELALLTPHPTVDGASRYLFDDVDEGRYNRRIIGSVTFYFAEKSKPTKFFESRTSAIGTVKRQCRGRT